MAGVAAAQQTLGVAHGHASSARASARGRRQDAMQTQQSSIDCAERSAHPGASTVCLPETCAAVRLTSHQYAATKNSRPRELTARSQRADHRTTLMHRWARAQWAGSSLTWYGRELEEVPPSPKSLPGVGSTVEVCACRISRAPAVAAEIGCAGKVGNPSGRVNAQSAEALEKFSESISFFSIKAHHKTSSAFFLVDSFLFDSSRASQRGSPSSPEMKCLRGGVSFDLRGTLIFIPCFKLYVSFSLISYI